MIKLRRAITKDIEALWAVRTAAIKGISDKFYTKSEVLTWASTAKPSDFEAVIKDFAWYVAEDGNHVVGCGFVDKATGEIGGIFVDPQFQRRNIGLQILSCLEAVAKEHNIRTLYLDATLNAEPFYSAAG